MHVGSDHDLWWGTDGIGGNMDAPRMLQEIYGDFALEVKMTSSEDRKEHGGILVWKDENRFIRLDKTSSLHAFQGDIRFEAHVNRRYQAIGRGRQKSVMNFLRLERTGHQFQAYCSTDGQSWQSCGTATIVMRDPVKVGMHALCPGNIPPTVTRFDYFKIIKPMAVTTFALV
jgi:regulation of enolase protein 1 (concanavalin A-like superfamily)